VQIGRTTPSSITDLWTAVEPTIRAATRLEDAAQVLVDAVCQRFEESVVLARMFVTVPYDSLPPSNRHFVKQQAERSAAAGDLRTVTPVLSLIGTCGQEPSWNDRRQSNSHVGIPLISSAFVDAVPMISRLLKELGIPLDWVDSQDSTMIEKTMGRSAGLFFVGDATEATDHRGRKIITAQHFVETYGVKAVFGIGGAYVGGQIVVLVVFCRDDVPQDAAESFLALTALFKNKTAGLVGDGKVFDGY
jgi:hypothetical protein